MSTSFTNILLHLIKLFKLYGVWPWLNNARKNNNNFRESNQGCPIPIFKYFHNCIDSTLHWSFEVFEFSRFMVRTKWGHYFSIYQYFYLLLHNVSFELEATQYLGVQFQCPVCGAGSATTRPRCPPWSWWTAPGPPRSPSVASTSFLETGWGRSRRMRSGPVSRPRTSAPSPRTASSWWVLRLQAQAAMLCCVTGELAWVVGEAVQWRSLLL